MGKGRRINRLTEALEIPPEVLVNVPRVEVVGHLQIRVENHQGVEFYQPYRVVLRTSEGKLVVNGQDLLIGWIDSHELLVTGHVRSVVFRGIRP